MPDVSRMTTANLIRRMEKSEDFKYDDEAVELNRRLKQEGYTWKWSDDFFHPHIIVYKQEEQP